jgi:hypothetical protein
MSVYFGFEIKRKSKKVEKRLVGGITGPRVLIGRHCRAPTNRGKPSGAALRLALQTRTNRNPAWHSAHKCRPVGSPALTTRTSVELFNTVSLSR